MDSQMTLPEWQGILDDTALGGLSFQDSVLDNQPVTTRAGLYIYLNSMLHDKPSFVDLDVNHFLITRYNEDITSLVSDLILASFDVLANAMYRNEPTRTTNIIRSFLANKLPVFIQANYAGLLFEPLTVEHCLRQAFSRVDPAAFPSFSQMLYPSARNNLLSEARQDFLFACALHELIPERSIEEILQETPMQNLPASGRYSKDDLVNQYTANPAKLDQLVGELENMEGNAGAISAAIVEILHILCADKDTMTLKSVCNTLSRKLSGLDIILLFIQPGTLLQPLCAVLDNWQDHDDQGEYQPVYDEFGSILLFITIMQHQFQLQHHEIGTRVFNSFVLQYLKLSSASRSLDDLTEHENHLLGSWIKGLFETEGISDELISTCKPKEFHLLIATLFDQSLIACQANVLTLDTLKGGFEYLLEPFLLPSLVAGLHWFSDRLWEINDRSTNVDTILPALQSLLKPSSMSHDSATIHSAVLSVVAKRLSESLSHVQQQYPSRSDINPLLGALSPYSQDRQDEAALSELSSWAITPGGGLLAALRQTLQNLAMWSVASVSSTGMPPTSYTHRLLRDSAQILGAKKILDLLLSEALSHRESLQVSETVFDIITIMIVAAQGQTSPASTEDLTVNASHSPRGRLTLYQILQSEYQDTSELSTTDPTRASMIVRLQRRVDALLGRKQISAEQNIPFMGNIVRNAEGLPTTDIDDVLGEAQNQIASAQNYLAGENAALLGMA